MSNYYQLSDDYELVDEIMRQGLPVVQRVNEGHLFVIKNDAGLQAQHYEALRARGIQFLVPAPDETELHHSLKWVLDEYNGLRAKNQDQIRIIQIMKAEIESLKESNSNLRQNYIAALPCDDESDQDYKSETSEVKTERLENSLKGLKMF